MHLQRTQRTGRRLAAPQVVDQQVGGHDLTTGHREPGEHGTLPRPAEIGGRACDLRTQWPEQAHSDPIHAPQ
ncbi:hypothetical protein GCM10009836_60050 [Pseudonocardia ailaonensis]|uniref:Uncharacterized protein n=1 Tax=Pseudonocardia ailaonensis TaxID=367279 RepID=A0ABN2NKH3_9PSEU